MKKRISLSLILTLMVFLKLVSPYVSIAEEEKPIDLIPKVSVFIIIRDIYQDIGVSYVMSLFRENLKERTRPQKRAIVDKIFDEFQIDQIVGGIILNQDIENPGYLVAFDSIGKDDLDHFQESAKLLFKKDKELSAVEYHDYRIIYSTDTDPGELMGYTDIKGNIVIGSSLELLKGVIDHKMNKAQARTVRKNYISEKAAIEDWDICAIINNKDEKITEILNKWSEDYHLTLLISADAIKEIIISFDMVDQDMIKGRIKFVSKNNDLPFYRIQDDARFFNEIIKRICFSNNINYIGEIESSSDYVVLDFDAQGFEKFWKKLFEKKQKLKIAMPAVSQETQIKEVEKATLPNHRVKILFVIFLIGLLAFTIKATLKLKK